MTAQPFSGGVSEEVWESPTTEGTCEIVMATMYRNHKLGVAVFDVEAGTLSVAEQMEHDDGCMSVLQLFKFQFRPTLLLCSSRCEERILSALKEPVDGEAEPQLELIPQHEFQYTSCSTIVCSLHLPEMGVSLTREERAKYISSFIDFEQQQLIGAAGALLSYLKRSNKVNSLMEDHSPLQICELRNISLDGIVTVDEQTHSALSVFEDDKHPSLQKIGVKKEGFSLYGLLAAGCSSKPGRDLIAQV